MVKLFFLFIAIFLAVLAVPSQGAYIDEVRAIQQGTWTVQQGTPPWIFSLPTNAATETKQDAGNASLSSIDGKIPANLTVNANMLLVDGSGVTQPISAASLPLPLGAATEATLATRASESTLSAINGKLNSLGQKTSANSAPVVLASDQSAIPVSQSGSWTTGRTWSLLNSTDSVNAVQSGTWNINNVSGTVSLPTGAATESSLAKLTQTQGSTTSGQSGPLVQGAVTTSAPSYTTGQTSPLSLDTNGRLRVTVAGSFSNFTAAGTTTLKSGAGKLLRVCMNTSGGNGHTITLYDNTTNAAPIIALITTAGGSVPGMCGQYDLNFSTGLTVTTTGTANWTVVYQ